MKRPLLCIVVFILACFVLQLGFVKFVPDLYEGDSEIRICRFAGLQKDLILPGQDYASADPDISTAHFKRLQYFSHDIQQLGKYTFYFSNHLLNHSPPFCS